MSFVFTPLASYSFTRPDANPLDPAFWSPTPPSLPSVQIGNLQVVSNACEGTSLVNNGGNGENFTPSGIVWPTDQYVQAQLSALTGTSEIGLYLLASPNVTSYYMLDIFDNGDGTVFFEILKGLPDYTVDVLFTNDSLPFTQTDVFLCAYIAGTIYCYQNGTLIGQASDADYTFGVPGLFIFPVTSLANARIVNYVAGHATDSNAPYSVPDCRSSSPFPNAARDLQATQIYVGQTSSNGAVPGIDSRSTGIPSRSSRVSFPVNSRTPGLYGPGE